ncbi:adenylate cyclase 1 [bacterium BMS3Bbin01]|nr:adenylate cyclase 1 [bacterium BMS3Bbin01]
MNCPNCGFENPPDQKFCGDCGTRLTNNCSSCGAANPHTQKFCGECGAALARAAPTPAVPEPGAGETAERRLVSVLFADLVGFTPFSEERDAEEVRELLTVYFDRAREIVARFGGEVDKFIGDAVMAVWGATTAQEDDAERAVRTALELVEMVERLGVEAGASGLALRAGVLTGEAATGRGGNDVHGLVVGDMVNTASRLQSLADPGAVLAGESTVRSASGSIDFEMLGPQVLKGKTEPVAVWRAARITGMRGGAGRRDGIEPPFVGRDHELRMLKDLLHATERERRARLVSIVGVAGVGKTRLVWELQKYVDGLTATVFWHEGRSPAYGEGATFWALGEMVRRRAGIAESDDEATASAKLAETIERLVETEEERRRLLGLLSGLLGLTDLPQEDRGPLFAAFRRFFESVADQGPTVLVFEDVHWADPGLLDFVEELPEWSRRWPILVLTLARPDLLERRPTWGAGKPNFVSMHLAPLADIDMREMIDGVAPGLPHHAVGALVSRSGGIPLYAVEYIRMLLADGRLVEEAGSFQLLDTLDDVELPETVRGVVGARLDRLSVDHRRVLGEASVLGQSFTLESLIEITEHPDAPAVLDALVRAELLEIERDPRSPERGQYRFVQPVIQEVAYRRLARADRRSLHLAVAHYFETGADEELAPIVASHYLSALSIDGDTVASPELISAARNALDRAVNRAASLHSHAQVLSLCDQALAVTDDPMERVRLLEKSALAACELADTTAYEERLREALQISREHGTTEDVERGMFLLARCLTDIRNANRAVELLADLDPDDFGRSRWLTAAGAQLARAHMIMGDGEPALAVTKPVLVAAEARGQLDVVADTLVTRGTLLGAGDAGRLHEGVALIREGRRLAVEHGFGATKRRASTNMGYILYEHDPLGSHTEYEAAFRQELEQGDRASALFKAYNMSSFYFDLGRFDEALAIFEDNFDVETFSGTALGEYLATRAVVATARGRVNEGDNLFEQVRRIAEKETDRQFNTQTVQGGAAIIDLMAGRLAHATEGFLQTFAGDQAQNLEYLARGALAALMNGDERGVGAMRDALGNASKVSPMRRASAATVEACVSAVEGALTDEQALDTVRRWTDLGWMLTAGLSWIAFAVGAPEIASGLDAAQKARDIFEPIGANGILALLDPSKAGR